MNSQRLHLYSFLQNLVKENYAKANKELKQVVEGKIRARAGKAKMRMYSEKRITGKAKTVKIPKYSKNERRMKKKEIKSK